MVTSRLSTCKQCFRVFKRGVVMMRRMAMSNYADNEWQAATIARLERELAEARQENSQMARMLAEPSEVKADAEALRALAAWLPINAHFGAVLSRQEDGSGYGVSLHYGDGYKGSSSPTLASAIMAALKKATHAE